MIFCSLVLLSFVLVLVPDVKNRVSAWMRESMAVCSILSGAQTGVNVASGWFNFTDQADFVRFSVKELSAAPGINRRWSWIDVKLQSSNLDNALKKFTRQSVLPNGDKTSFIEVHAIVFLHMIEVTHTMLHSQAKIFSLEKQHENEFKSKSACRPCFPSYLLHIVQINIWH